MNKDNTVHDNMLNGNPLILLNKEDEGKPVYRMLVQTDKELPAHDMGLKSIKYNQEAITKALKDLEGHYIYDESQSSHNRKVNPEMRGHKFSQVINTGYCPDYGGYVDMEVFDPEYVPLMEQAMKSYKDGLPVREGPSTEINPLKIDRYDENSVEVTQFEYSGLVWDSNIRDNSLGICSVVNNSIKEIVEAQVMPEKQKEEIIKEFTLTKEEYDAIMQYQTDYNELKTLYDNLKPEDFKEYQELQSEKEDLYTQLVPIWNEQGEAKMEMVNSILETIPEADRESQKEKFQDMEIDVLRTIINAIPEQQERGVQDGGEDPTPSDDDNTEIMEQLKKIGFI